MVSASTLYLFFIYENISAFIGISLLVVMIVIFVSALITIFVLADEKGIPELIQKYAKKTIIIAVVLTILCIAMPSKNEVATIYIIPKLSRDKNIVELFPNIAKLANETIKGLLSDLSGQGKERNTLKQ